MITAVLFAALLDAAAALAQGDNRNNANAAAVRTVLEAQAAAWNRGDIDGYMDGYARDEMITFISGDTVTRGWKTVLDRYKRSYDMREKMGTPHIGCCLGRTCNYDGQVTISPRLLRSSGQPSTHSWKRWPFAMC